MIQKIRIVYLLMFVALYGCSFFVGTFLDVNELEKEQLIKEINKITENIDIVGIFLHNLGITFVMFIPGVGVIWGIISAISTGTAFSVLSAETSISIHPLMALFSTPFGLMEVVSYGIAMSRGTLILLDVVKKKNPIKQIKRIILEIFIVCILLLTGAILEITIMNYAVEIGLEII
ncbi:MAG: hypothetical protein MAG458_01485 [Nitrosopumilus sp.]|nr:hypothetical protein [Nitrosopumilus sp.]